MRQIIFGALVVIALVASGPVGAERETAPMAALSQGRTPAFGDYQFGMTRDEVQRVATCGPYRVVPGTKGLECSNLVVGSRRMNVSFIFTGERLTRVQLWFYEGQSERAAREATAEMLAYLSKRGPIRSRELDQAVPTPEAIFQSLRARDTGKGARVQVLLPPASRPPFVHGSVTGLRSGYFVFVFFSASADATSSS